MSSCCLHRTMKLIQLCLLATENVNSCCCFFSPKLFLVYWIYRVFKSNALRKLFCYQFSNGRKTDFFPRFGKINQRCVTQSQLTCNLRKEQDCLIFRAYAMGLTILPVILFLFLIFYTKSIRTILKYSIHFLLFK